MPIEYGEIAFESAIEHSLIATGGYEKGDPESINLKNVGIYSLIDKIRQSIDRLREYCTALISAAVTGKIDVREKAR